VLIQIANILEGEALAEAQTAMAALTFEDGKATAGWSARLVKENQQVPRGDAKAEPLKQKLAARIAENEVFQLAVRPKRLSPLTLSRYQAGMAYGTHVDDALMGGMRSDVSFTLFLSDPATYDGGALVIESASGEEDVKLPAGALVAYPSGSLHRVAPVTSGVRLAAVGWVRSYLRTPEQRELLFDLETARRSLFTREGKSHEFDLMSKASANLLRMWAED
jgi:PKHD-type hydroxylase